MKKIISMLLVVTLLITFMMPAMASSSTSADKGLENAIKAVKGRINIPADCNKFTYNIYNQDGAVIWNLGWSNEEAQKYINVTIDESNFISNYSSYQYSSYYDKKIPKYSKAQGREIAEKFIEKLNPKLLSEFKAVENNNYSQDREYYFSYVRQVSGINYNGNTISISVNNYTGQVTNYNCGYTKNVVFEDASKVIGLDQAKKAFVEKLGLKLVYNIKSDNDKVISYLAYVPKDSNRYIDAITGNVEKTPNSFGINYTGAMMEKMAYSNADGGAVVLTPDELDAVKGMSGLLTKEELDTKMRAISQFKLDSGFTLASSELRKDWRNKDSLIWYLRYTKVNNADSKQTREVSISLDAKTGDIIDFWTNYYSPEGAKPQKSKDEAKKISDDALKSLIPLNYSKVKYDDTYYTYDEESQNQFTFRYVRIENGLEVPSDYISISYDNLSGNVTSVNTNWTKDLKFDDPKKAISVDKATEVLFDKIGYGIEYVGEYQNNSDKSIVPIPAENQKVNAVLGYFINGSKPCIISAETGDILNYTGAEYRENDVADYNDIKGLAAENQVKILTQLSIRYYENELKANDQLLQKDYFILLSKLNDLYYFDSSIDKEAAVEKMYTNLISSGIITKAEKAPTATLTREEAAKYFVKFMKMGQVAEIKGIYKSDYKDANKINPDLLGYVCIASGLKAMSDSKGNFNPKSKMSRLDGLLTIYNYLSNK